MKSLTIKNATKQLKRVNIKMVLLLLTIILLFVWYNNYNIDNFYQNKIAVKILNLDQNSIHYSKSGSFKFDLQLSIPVKGSMTFSGILGIKIKPYKNKQGSIVIPNLSDYAPGNHTYSETNGKNFRNTKYIIPIVKSLPMGMGEKFTYPSPGDTGELIFTFNPPDAPKIIIKKDFTWKIIDGGGPDINNPLQKNTNMGPPLGPF